MEGDIMTPDLFECTKNFEALVYCLLSVPCPLLHAFRLRRVSKTFWTLDVLWVFTKVSAICFNKFTRFKIAHEGVLEDL